MNKKDSNYHEQVKKQNILKLRELEGNLPPFCRLYFRGISERIANRTLVGYAYDLQIFFYYVRTVIFPKKKLSNKEMNIDILDRITKFDIEGYLEFLSLYTGEDGTEHTNDARGKARKLASLRSLYNYFYESEMIKTNPASIVHVPKIKEKQIIRLESDEVAELLDSIEYGEITESEHQKHYSDQNRTRDLALITLLLSTGMRVSECVGINLNDIDYENQQIKIIRKGGKEAMIYYGDEAAAALADYLQLRNHMIPLSGHEDALFLSMQNKRIGVRSVEKLVKKYTEQIISFKNITPHKLRSTYGTQLYRETGDIYLVASVLGHKDVNTTKKHYASMDEDKKRKAANTVKLRKD